MFLVFLGGSGGWYIINGQLVSAGQIDAVMSFKGTGTSDLFDWKRADNKPALAAARESFAGRCDSGLCSAIPDTHFHKYSLQCSIYAIMIIHSPGLDVGDRLYLVRMHEDRDDYQLIHDRYWRCVARSLLEAEHARLLAQQAEVTEGVNTHFTLRPDSRQRARRVTARP